MSEDTIVEFRTAASGDPLLDVLVMTRCISRSTQTTCEGNQCNGFCSRQVTNAHSFGKKLPFPILASRMYKHLSLSFITDRLLLANSDY